MSMKQRYDELEQAIVKTRQWIEAGLEKYICIAAGYLHVNGEITRQARDDLYHIVDYGLDGLVSLESWLHRQGHPDSNTRAIRLEWLDAIHEQLIAERKERT